MTDFQKPKKRADGKRHDCKNKPEGCNGGTNQGHRTCPICLQKEARARNSQTAIDKEKKKQQARKSVVAQIELEKDLINYTPKPKRKTRGKKYRNAQQELLDTHGKECRGCGATNTVLHTSHRVPEKEPEGRAIVEDVKNLDLVCPKCHDKIENGLWDSLLIEEELHIYIREVAPKYYARKIMQQNKIHQLRINEKNNRTE